MCILEKIKSWRYKKGQAFGSYLHQISKTQDELDQLESLTQFLSNFYNNIPFIPLYTYGYIKGINSL